MIQPTAKLLPVSDVVEALNTLLKPLEIARFFTERSRYPAIILDGSSKEIDSSRGANPIISLTLNLTIFTQSKNWTDIDFIEEDVFSKLHQRVDELKSELDHKIISIQFQSIVNDYIPSEADSIIKSGLTLVLKYETLNIGG